jgi:hypothetical protein
VPNNDNQATHEYIQRKQRQALEALQRAQRQAHVDAGYKNFDLAISALQASLSMVADSWARTHDHRTALPALEAVRVNLNLFHSGAAAASVAAAISEIDEIFSKLKWEHIVPPPP